LSASVNGWLNSPRVRKSMARFASLVLLLAARTARADASEFRPELVAPVTPIALQLPVELTLGDAWRHWRSGPAATAELSLLPGFSYGRWELNGVARGLYRNPSFDFAIGARTGVRVGELLDGLFPVYLAADGTFLTVHSGFRGAGGAQLGVGTLARLGLWAGWDTSTDRALFSFSLLTDISKWGDPIGAILELTPTEDFSHAGQ
jgi:hypothetical protein